MKQKKLPAAVLTNMGTAVLLLILLRSPIFAVNDGFARTPPMGWNSWNHFACNNITEELFMQMADAMVSSGMKDAGYTFLNIDDCWEGSRDASGYISTNESFTNKSMKTLATYVHSKGLKFGIYTSAGKTTCQNYPGSLGYEDKDIEQYAKWGVDYVKVDWGGITQQQNEDPMGSYKIYYDAIQKYQSINPMILSICCWGRYNVWVWGGNVGHLWRTTPDIALGWQSFTDIIDKQVDLYPYAGPGGWNDPDMLEVGRGMSVEEDKAHFGMWCLLAAPLIAGNDLRNMSTTTIEILTNRDLISVDQDSMGIQAQRVNKDGDLEVWARPLVGNARAVGLFNRSTSEKTMTVNWADLNKWENTNLPWSEDKSVTVRNLWTYTDIAEDQTGSYSMPVPGHGLGVLKLYVPAGIIDRNRIDISGKDINFRLGLRSFSLYTPLPHTIVISKTNGKTVYKDGGAGTKEYSLSIINSPGVYYITVKTRNGTYTRKALIVNGAVCR